MAKTLAVRFSDDLLKDQRRKVEAQQRFVHTLLGGGRPVPLSPTRQPQPQPQPQPKMHPKTHVSKRPTAPRPSPSPAEGPAHSPAAQGLTAAQLRSVSQLIDEKVEARAAKLDEKWAASLQHLEERVAALEAGAGAVATLSAALDETQRDVEKRDARSVALMKKLHAIHGEELEERARGLQEEHAAAVESVREDLRAQSKEVIRLKAALAESSGGSSGGNSSSGSSGNSGSSGSGGAGGDTAVQLRELSLRLGRLETQSFAAAAEQASSTSGSGGSGGSGGSSASTAARAAPSRDEHLHAAALREAMAELGLQLSDVEAEVQHLRGSVKQTAQALLQDRQQRKEAAAAQGPGGGLAADLASLQKKVHGVGRHASKAIQELSQSLTDLQYNILAIYSWSNSVNAKLYLPVIDESRFRPPEMESEREEGREGGREGQGKERKARRAGEWPTE